MRTKHEASAELQHPPERSPEAATRRVEELLGAPLKFRVLFKDALIMAPLPHVLPSDVGVEPHLAQLGVRHAMDAEGFQFAELLQ